MESHLSSRDFFVDDKFSIADIALFAYTHVAHEGDYDLEAFPAIQKWITRVQAYPGFVPMRHEA